MKNVALIGAAAMLALAAGTARAEQLTYIYTGLGIGTIGDLSFDDVPFEVRITANTENILQDGVIYFVLGETATISIEGVTASFDDPMYAFVNQLNNESLSVVGFSRDTRGFLDVYDLSDDTAFSTYDLSTVFPLTTADVYSDSFFGLQTSAGLLSMSVALNEGTFEVIPSPGVGALALVAGFAALRRRRA